MQQPVNNRNSMNSTEQMAPESIGGSHLFVIPPFEFGEDSRLDMVKETSLSKLHDVI